MEENKVNIREMTMEDFEEVHALWMGIHGFGIRSIDDSKEGAKMEGSSVRFCVVMMEDADVYIMSAFTKITESRALDKRWWRLVLQL